MTKTNLPNHNQPTALVYAKWQLKRNLVLALLPTILQFIFVGLPRLASSDMGSADGISFLYAFSGLLFFFSLIFVLILVHRTFSFMHKQSEAYFIFSLPTSRLKLYLSLWGVVICVLVLGRLLSFVQNLIYFAGADRLLYHLMSVELSLLLKLLAVASFLIYFYTISNNSFYAQVQAVEANIAYLVIWLALMPFAETMLPGFRMNILGSIRSFLISPYIAGFLNPLSATYSSLYWLVFSLFFFCLSAYRFNKRAAEQQGKANLDRPSYRIIKLMTSVSIGFLGAFILAYLRQSITGELESNWLILISGLVLGSILSSLIEDLVYSKGELSLGSSLRRATANLLPLGLIFAFLISGGLGYTNKEPSRDKTQAIELSKLSSDFYPVSSLFGVIPDSEVSEPVDKSAETLRIEDPDRIELLGQIVGNYYQRNETYMDKLKALSLPRDLSSKERLQLDNSNNYGDAVAYSVDITWQDRLPLSKARTIDIYITDEESLEQLNQDPGLALFLLNSSPWQAYQEFSVEIFDKESGQTDGGVTGPEAWQELAKMLEQMRVGTPFYHIPDLLTALQLDYNSLSEQERLALVDQPVAEVNLYIHLQDDRSEAEVWLDAEESLEREDKHTDTLPFIKQVKLPLGENFKYLKKAIEKDYALFKNQFNPNSKY